MAAQRDGLGEAPSPKELLAYRDGLLEPAERQRLEARLALYPDAAHALADLAAFPEIEPAPGLPELTDDDVAARWQAFRDRLPERPEPRQSEPPAPPRLRASRSTSNLRLAAAALAALAVGSAAGFFGSRAGQEVPGSAVNVDVVVLNPVEEGTRAAPEPRETPPGSEELLLVLNVSMDQDFADYEAEIADAHGIRVWSRHGLRPTAEGTFRLSFRRGVLPVGPLRVRLFGMDGESRRLLGTYEVRLLP